MKLSKILALCDLARLWATSDRAETEKALEEIERIQQKLVDYMEKTHFSKRCETCQHVCCASFMPKIAFSLPEVLYYVAKKNPELRKRVEGQGFQKGRCALLTENGCVLSPTGKPKICISYFCQFPYKKETIPLVTELGYKFYDLHTILDRDASAKKWFGK